MSNGLISTLIVCATVVVVSVIVTLAAIALLRDGPEETTIIAALIGLPTIIITAGAPIFAHWQAAQTTLKNEQSIVAQSKPENTPQP